MRGADRKKPTKKPSTARTVVRPRWFMNINAPRGIASGAAGPAPFDQRSDIARFRALRVVRF
jgi:hypothetical protein